MFKVLAILAFALVGVAYGGPVSSTSCGGVAEFIQLRVEGSEGDVAIVGAGTAHRIEAEFITSAAASSLTLDAYLVYFGVPVPIINVELPNSSVQPGIQITVALNITPNDILRGQQVPVSAEVRHTTGGVVEICRTVQVRVV